MWCMYNAVWEGSHDHGMTDHMIKKRSPIRVKSIIPHITAGTYSRVYFFKLTFNVASPLSVLVE